MRPIRNIEDIENLKTDEKLIECLGSYANYEPLFSHLITWFSW